MNDITKKLIEKANLKYYILNGIFYMIVTNLYKPYAQKFIFRIGGGETMVSLFNALPGLMAVLVLIPGVYFISKAKKKVRLVSILFILSRIMVVSFAVVPFLPPKYQAITFVILSALMFLPESIAVNALQSISADCFEVEHRAYAISNRNKMAVLISIVLMIILGQIMRAFGSDNATVIFIYQLFFLASSIFAVFEILTFVKMKEITEPEPLIQEGMFKAIKEVFKNKTYMIFLSCSLLFHFGWQMGWPLFAIYQIKNLNADEMWITIIAVVVQFFMFITYNYWQREIGRKGLKKVIAFSTLGMALSPILVILSPNLYFLALANGLIGFFSSGCTVAILCSTIDASPDKDRMVYMNVHATLTNVTLFVSPLVANLFLHNIGMIGALIITALFRLLGSLAFYLREKHT